jgi:hypothetical protein
MNKTIILRFRDLVTEEGGTINEHQKLIRQFGEAWWGWWARQSESSPRQLFYELTNVIKTQGSLTGYLFDTGRSKLYSAEITKILAAPQGQRVATPDPEGSPDYYHRAKYPAWFLIRSLKEVDFSDLEFIYDSFPTRSEQDISMDDMVGKRIQSLKELRQIDVTLWVVQLGD